MYFFISWIYKHLHCMCLGHKLCFLYHRETLLSSIITDTRTLLSATCLRLWPNCPFLPSVVVYGYFHENIYQQIETKCRKKWCSNKGHIFITETYIHNWNIYCEKDKHIYFAESGDISWFRYIVCTLKHNTISFEMNNVYHRPWN